MVSARLKYEKSIVTDFFTKNEKRDQYAVVLEDLRSDFKAFGENLSIVRERVENIDGRLGHVEKKLDLHTQMIARVMEDVEEIKSGMREKSVASH
jgi:hypothetical protein